MREENQPNNEFCKIMEDLNKRHYDSTKNNIMTIGIGGTAIVGYLSHIDLTYGIIGAMFAIGAIMGERKEYYKRNKERMAYLNHHQNQLEETLSN